MTVPQTHHRHLGPVPVLVLLTIEFLDEFIYGAREAAWPLISSDLALNYTQVGLLLSLPNVIGNLVELSIGVLADVWKRRALIVGGGIAFSAALLLVAYSMDFPLLVDMSIHHFDLIRFVTGLDPERVQGVAWNPPWSNYAGDCSSTVVFEMSNGARVVYSGSWCAKGQFCNWDGNWQIECDKGTLVYSRDNITHHSVPTLYAE